MAILNIDLKKNISSPLGGEDRGEGKSPCYYPHPTLSLKGRGGFIFVLTIFFFLNSVAFSQHLTSSNQLYQEAVAQAKNHQYLDAIGNLLQVLKQDPNNDGAKQYLWVIAKRLTEKKASVPTSLQRNLWVQDAKERLARQKKRRDQILEQLRHAFEGATKNKNPSALLSASEVVQGIFQSDPELLEIKTSKAQEEFQAILAELDRASLEKGFSRRDLYMAKGFLAYFNGNWQEASQLWSMAKKEEGNDPRFMATFARIEKDIEAKKREEEISRLVEQADAYSKSGLLDDAIGTWREVQKIDPAYPNVQLRIGEILKKKLAKERDAGVQKDIGTGIVLFKKGNFIDAAQNFIEALTLDPNNQEAGYWLKLTGHRLKSEQKKVIPLPNLEVPKAPEPTEKDMSRVKELYKQGLILYSEGDTEKAKETFQEVLRIDPGHAQSRRALERIAGEPSVPE